MGTRSVVLSGGEPLVWPWLPQAVRECNTQGVECSIYTSGIDRTRGMEWIPPLRDMGLRRAVFSLYSPEQAEHERVTRRAGSFNSTLRAIQAAGESGLETQIHFVPMKRNYRQLADLVALVEGLGVSKVSILRLVPHGRGAAFKNSQEILREEEMLWLRNEVLRLRRQSQVEIRTGSPYNVLALGRPTPCTAASGTLIVLPNGNIYPCDAFKNIEASELGIEDPYGNILAAPLTECWHKSTYLERVRDAVRRAPAAPCAACSYFGRCQSGCLAQKALYYQAESVEALHSKPDPLCLRHLMGGDL